MCKDPTALNKKTEIHYLVAMILIRDLSACSGGGRGFPKYLVLDTTQPQAMYSSLQGCRCFIKSICTRTTRPHDVLPKSNLHQVSLLDTCSPSLGHNFTTL
jgi:hypothetical protein